MSCYNTHIEMCCTDSACDTLELKENSSCYYNAHTKTLDCILWARENVFHLENVPF